MANYVASWVNVARCEYFKSLFLEGSELGHRDVLGRAALIRVGRKDCDSESLFPLHMHVCMQRGCARCLVRLPSLYTLTGYSSVIKQAMRTWYEFEVPADRA